MFLTRLSSAGKNPTSGIMSRLASSFDQLLQKFSVSRNAFSGWTSRGGGSCDGYQVSTKGTRSRLPTVKLGDCFEVFAVRLDRRVENQSCRFRYRFQTAVAPAHPRHDRSVPLRLTSAPLWVSLRKAQSSIFDGSTVKATFIPPRAAIFHP